MKTKTIATIIAMLFSMLWVIPTSSVFAIKPGAEFVSWNLSADVMPAPPYGTRDMPGSDDASKLIANQPNGQVEVVLTGVMNCLKPNTVHKVYLLPHAYTPGSFTSGWVWMTSFTTDVDGHGDFHLNLYDSDFPGPAGSRMISIWINEGGYTILISDNFEVIID